ncbi:MAG: hypothetical protein V2A75_08155 [Pseudomonadota bacterium]
MEKKPKLNLKTIDFSKAKLPLDENEKPPLPSISPELDLSTNGEDKKSAAQQAIEKLTADFQAHEKSKKTAIEQLYEEIELAYKNPIFETFKQIEDDKKTFLGGLVDSAWSAESLQSKISELEKSLNNPSIAAAFKSAQDYEAFTKPLLGSIEHKGLGLAEALAADYKQYLKPEYATVQSAMEQFRKTIDSPSIQNTLSHLENFKTYKSGLAYATAAIENNRDLLGSSKILAGLGTSIASDSLEYKIAEQSRTIPSILKREYTPLKIPKNPLPAQNAQIISILEILKEQNDTLITVNSELLQIQTSDSDIQNNIILLMQNQQGNNEIIVNELKTQNEKIEDQLIELKKQNEKVEIQIGQKDTEIAENKGANSFTRKIALWGIGISIVVGLFSIAATYHISSSEKVDNDNDNVQLLKAINDKSTESQKQDQLIKLIEEQNKYLKKLAEREPS